MYGVAQTRTRLLGRRTLNPQAVKQVLSECAISTSRQNLAQILIINPNRMYPVAHARQTSRQNYFKLQLASMYVQWKGGGQTWKKLQDEVLVFREFKQLFSVRRKRE